MTLSAKIILKTQNAVGIPPKKLTEIRGIGTSVSDKLIDHFGSESDALAALAQRDILTLIKIEGVSERMAVRLIRSYHTALTGEKIEIDQILQSNDIIKMYERLIKLIQSRASTQYAQTKALISLNPIPITNYDKILKQQQFFKDCTLIMQHNINHLSQIKKALRGIKTLQHGKRTTLEIPERIIVTTVPESMVSFEKYGISKNCQIKLLVELELFQEILDQNEEVLLLTEQDIGSSESETYVIVPENALESPWVNFIPEKILSFYSNNKNTLERAIELSQTIKLPPELGQRFFPQLTRPNLAQDLIFLEQYLSKLTSEGEIQVTIDPELKRLSQALESLDNKLLELQAKLNEFLTDEIGSMQFQLEGKKILELLQSLNSEEATSVNIREYIDESIIELVETQSIKTEAALAGQLNLTFDEQEILEGLFPRELAFPLEINEEIVEKVRNLLQSKRHVREFIQKRSIAEALENHRSWLEDLVNELFEIDYYLMIGQCGIDFQLKLPEFTKKGVGINIEGGLNLFLQEEIKQRKLNHEILPVTYKVGSLGLESNTRITLLSGANSGGKTTLLHLVTQILLLAHMGLGVPAKFTQLSGFNELFYYQKPTGTADAGAFETALQTFSKMVMSNTSKFILADEMEAISEPEASAKVISAILDLLQNQKLSCGIFVSHLADQISEQCTLPIRIDGIEASGLDDNLELVVDRNPRLNYHARSTPQLIVERLIGKSKESQKQIYQAILDKFKEK
ncbi:MAG: hypothetical protein ACXAC7_00430 [Candidatus Hodarchaeales archaeon]|jgi:hypothetical protein